MGASGGYGDRHFPGHSDYFDQSDQGFTKVCQGFFLGSAFTVRSHPGPKLGMGAPDAILVAFDDYGNRHNMAF